MATHSSILAWRIPWTEEPGRLQSMGSQRVGHNLATLQLYSNGDWMSLLRSNIHTPTRICTKVDRDGHVMSNYRWAAAAESSLWFIPKRAYSRAQCLSDTSKKMETQIPQLQAEVYQQNKQWSQKWCISQSGFQMRTQLAFITAS